jgi:G protein beta subunit-like protein
VASTDTAKGFVFLWKLAQINGETALIPVTKFLAHSAYITRVLISPDVKILATCSADHTARIWTIAVPETPPAQSDQQAKQLGQREDAPPTRNTHARSIRDPDEDDDEEDEDDEDDDLDDDDEGSSDLSPGTSPPLSPGTRLAPRSPRPNRMHQAPSQQQSQQQLPERPLRTAMTGTQRDTLTSTALQHTHSAHASTAVPQPPDTQTGHPVFRPNELSARHSSAQRNQQGTPLPLQTTLQGHQRWVWDCAFSADSAYLVTACSDHYARLWELGSKTVIRQYNGHHRGAVCVALNDYSER